MSRRAWIPATPGVETPGIEGTFPVEMADWAALATRIAEPSDSCAIGVPLLTIALSTPASLTAEPSLGQANGNVLHILELLGFHDRPSQRLLSDRFLVNDRGRRVHEPFCES